MTDWQDKAWGKTRCDFSTPFASQHTLKVKAGGYCSLHLHHERANRFVVLSGKIAVVEFYGPRRSEVVLTKDNTHDVPSLVPHLFKVLEDGEVIELYWPDRGGVVRDDDIERFSQGGMVGIEELSGIPD